MMVSEDMPDQGIQREATSSDANAIPSSKSPGMKGSTCNVFSLPSWGRTRILRCFKVSGQSSSSPSPSIPSDQPPQSPPGMNDSPWRRDLTEVDDEEEEEDLKDLRKKLMVHFDVAVDKIKKAANKEEKQVISPPVTATKPAAEEVVKSKHWNLRKRRADSNATIENGRRGRALSSPVTAEKINGGRCVPEEKSVCFSLSLTKNEIEADFIRMLSARPPKKPKKRSLKEQRQLDMLFPGMWLSEVSAETYKVQEVRRR